MIVVNQYDGGCDSATDAHRVFVSFPQKGHTAIKKNSRGLHTIVVTDTQAPIPKSGYPVHRCECLHTLPSRVLLRIYRCVTEYLYARACDYAPFLT